MPLRHLFILCILFISVTLNAQNSGNDFQKEWQEVDTLILKKNLTKSALEKVKLIYQQAKEKKLSAQIIKSLIYQNGLEENISKENQKKGIAFLQQEIGSATDESEKAILNVLLAKQYRNYFYANQWNIYNRKTTVNFVKEDIVSWGMQDFSNAIARCYSLSLQNKKLLQQTPIDQFDAALIKGNSRNVRPTLFDLLAHEALDYFNNADMGGLFPVTPYNFTDKRLLQSANDFLSAHFITTDSSAAKWQSVQLYQQLMEFHKNDLVKDAFIQIDLERIEWAYAKLVNADKESLYKNTLQNLVNQYPSYPLIARAWFLLAKLEADKARNYQPLGDTSNRYGYAKAQSIIEKALEICKEGNSGIDDLRNLSTDIHTRSLQLQTEKINVPYKPFRALAVFRNSEKLFMRIIKIDNNDSIRNQINDYSKFWKSVKLLPVFRSVSFSLPANIDYQTHSAEIKIDGLPVGEYALLSSNQSDFDDSTNNLSVCFTYVSNISYIKNKNDFFVVNRETGMPIEGVKVTILRQQYINRLRKVIDDSVGVRTTNKNGYFRFEPNNGAYSYRYLFTTATDKLNVRETDYSSPDYAIIPDDFNDSIINSIEKGMSRIFFFTDRAIYRPGQTLFFKGLSITQDPKTQMSKLYLLKDSVSVNLNDVNGKIIATQKFLINSYGSFSGQFELPQNLLTGNFRISADSKIKNGMPSQTVFSVEEYKRPKFSITFDKVKGSYRLNDSITVYGSAKALAGNVVDGAKMKFNITRVLNYNAVTKFKNAYLRNTSQEISHGEIHTDAEGRFAIRFKALADETALKEDNPFFSFTIHADITDLNGETRSAETNINAGFSSIRLSVAVQPVIELDSFKSITIGAMNFSNEKEPAHVSVKIYSLELPARFIRKRYWQQPDQFIYSEKEFLKYFPTDEYANESDMLSWKRKEIVTEGVINTGEKNRFIINEGTLSSGYYQVEVTANDKYGEEAKEIRYVQLFSQKNNQHSYPAYQFSYQDKNNVEPGETAHIYSGSSANPVFVISKTDHPGVNKNNYDFEIRKAGIKNSQVTPAETDRGGIYVTETYVIDNRVYNSMFYINVLFSNKELKLKYASYRDKTEPGSTEKWTVTITNNKNEKTDAELLTAMYDASLDQFRQQNWLQPQLWQRTSYSSGFTGYLSFAQSVGNQNYVGNKYTLNMSNKPLLFDRLPNNGQELWGNSYDKTLLEGRVSGVNVLTNNKQLSISAAGSMNEQSIAVRGSAKRYFDDGITEREMAAGIANRPSNNSITSVIRKNFNETAFFFPQLYADTSGNYSLRFTMPEALTQWKWMSFAHTKDLSTGMQSANIITQKTLMVQPNAPRFLREGDNIEMNSKIVNLSNKEITGQVTLELMDAVTNTSVDGWFQNIFPSQYFTVEAGQSAAVKFPIQIPFSFNKPLKWRIVAKAGEFSDGEENVLPVLTNRTLVTESMPLFLSGDTTQHFVMKKLLSNTSETLTNQGITVEYTSNPVWTAVQALPYLMEYPYECAEQTFNRLYANALGAYIINKHPRIKQVMEKWKTDSVAMKSNLQKNEELKQVLLQETPWVLQAENEAQQKKNISLLFDLVKLENQTSSLIEKLNQLQLSNGAFPWFKGGEEDRYITNYILTGIGKLKKLGALSPEISAGIKNVLVKALKYADEKNAEDYKNLIKSKHNLDQQNITSTQIEYLYMRSFFRDIGQQYADAYDYYYKQGKQYWIKQNTYYKAQLGLICYRTGDEKFATNTLLPALTENAVVDAKMGMFWKSAYAGYWYQSPIEHQSMMIAFMGELNNDKSNSSLTKNLNAMKTWLLLNKQTNNWKTTIATADACYALLVNGTDWVNTDKKISIQLGKYSINSSNEKTEAGSGYFKKRIDGKEVTTEMGNIVVSTKLEARSTNKTTATQLANKQVSQSTSWGSIYWQYFEDLDKITPSASPLSISKKLFIEKNTDKGKVLDPVNENDELKVGDKIVVRLELRSDRDMDYLHLKDMRASSMEPVNVVSSYKWQDGLGYYESTKDVSSNFFISHLNKGTYVFDYPLFITHAGVFSVGIATIQSMYAPEFNSHSEGIKIRVSATN